MKLAINGLYTKLNDLCLYNDGIHVNQKYI